MILKNNYRSVTKVNNLLKHSMKVRQQRANPSTLLGLQQNGNSNKVQTSL
jgi:hypothetical protein